MHQSPILQSVPLLMELHCLSPIVDPPGNPCLLYIHSALLNLHNGTINTIRCGEDVTAPWVGKGDDVEINVVYNVGVKKMFGRLSVVMYLFCLSVCLFLSVCMSVCLSNT